jgi:hypothetical protein
MGRLIDSDKLKAQVEAHEIIKEFSITEYECGHNEGICMAVDDIEDAETVEAIPVDWLLRKADWCDKNNGIFVSGAIRSAVDAWREEQNNVTNKP